MKRESETEKYYGMVRWCGEDVQVLLDKEGKVWSESKIDDFLQWGERQLVEDMIQRGWDSLEVLLGLYEER